MRLFTRHSRAIYSYILTLLLNQSDADEVYQETSIVLWEKFDDYQAGTNFQAWACRIAFFEVRNFRRKHKRSVPLSNEVIELVAEDTLSMAGHLDDRQQALEGCLGKLPVKDRELIRHRYYENLAPKEIAQRFRRSVYAVYRALNRIHDTLFRCIELSAAEEGQA